MESSEEFYISELKGAVRNRLADVEWGLLVTIKWVYVCANANENSAIELELHEGKFEILQGYWV